MGRKGFALVAAGLFLYIASPLLFPVAMGAVIAVLFTPWLEQLEKRKIAPKSGAAILTLGITLVLLIPTSFLIFMGAKAAFQQLQELRMTAMAQANAPGGGVTGAVLAAPWAHHLVDFVTRMFPVGAEEVVSTATDLVRNTALKLAEAMTNLMSHLPGMGTAIAVIVVSVYFFLVDGRRLIFFLRRNSIFTAHQTDLLFHTLAGMCRSVILASVVSGLAQSAFESVVALVAGVPNVALLGMAVFVGSFIPVVGASPVTFGTALFILLSGHTGAGIALIGAAVFVIALDNLIRPWFLTGSAHLHPLLVFVSAFGGLQTLGFLGIFLGPIVAAMFMVSLEFLTHSEEAPAAPAPRAYPL